VVARAACGARRNGNNGGAYLREGDSRELGPTGGAADEFV
jgi:hypothetical protein